jgi:hypothetical protein
VVVVLFNAGDQEPVMPFKEVVGNTDNAAPEQIAATGVKVGITFGLMVTEVVAVTAAQPPLAAIVYVTR